MGCSGEAMPYPVYYFRFYLLKLDFKNAGSACKNKYSLGSGG